MLPRHADDNLVGIRSAQQFRKSDRLTSKERRVDRSGREWMLMPTAKNPSVYSADRRRTLQQIYNNVALFSRLPKNRPTNRLRSQPLLSEWVTVDCGVAPWGGRIARNGPTFRFES